MTANEPPVVTTSEQTSAMTVEQARQVLRDNRRSRRQAHWRTFTGAPKRVWTTTTSHIPERRDENGRMRPGIVAFLVVVALLVVGAGGVTAGMLITDNQNDALQAQINELKNSDSSDDTSSIDDQIAELEEQIASLQDENEQLREDIEQADEAAVQTAASRAPPSGAEIVDQALLAAGFQPGQWTYDIDRELAQAATSGAGRFTVYTYSPDEYVAYLNSGVPSAQASATAAKEHLAKNGILVSDENLRNPANWTTAQLLVDSTFGGNTLFQNGEALPAGQARQDPAGSVVHIYTGPEMAAYFDALTARGEQIDPDVYFVTRAACGNPQTMMPRPQNPPTTPPTSEPKQTQVCNPATGAIITVALSEAGKYKPVGDAACKTTTEPKKVYRCDSLTKTDNVLVTEEQAKDTNRYKPVGDIACAPPTVDKCTDDEGEGDGFCGTPNDGAEQQPVGDNGSLDDPTPGYTPGDAEQNDQEQGPPCSGTSCGLDPTPSGTEVEDSEDGGGAPGGDVVTPVEQPDQAGQPADSGDPNPGYDGSAPTQNPDEGTADPVDTPTTDETAPAGSDPLGGLDLPNVP